MDVLSRIKEDKGFVGNAMHIPREAQAKARRLCWKFNNSDPDDPKAQRDILMRLFGTYYSSVYLMPSFRCDSGFNIHINGFALVNIIVCFSTRRPFTLAEVC